MHTPRVCKILKIESEAENIKTIYFKDRRISRRIVPGQFIMVWIPGVDEIPMGVSHIGLNSELAITVEAVGEATERLCSLKEGDVIGVRGPYGRGFSNPGLNNLVIGGGTGMAPLIPLIELCVREGVKVNVLLGGRSLNRTPFIEKLSSIFKSTPSSFRVTTEDGSYGYRGLVTDLLEEIVLKNNFERVYACGPELMLRKIYEYSIERKLPLEVSLERYIKCGVGVCGSCYIGPYRVCVEGPVFKINELEKIRDVFGEWTRDAAGRLISLK